MARSLLERLEAEPIKAERENLHEVKVALDDALVKFMTEEAGYAENHAEINLKLVVAFVLNVIGGATALYAYKTPFEKGKLYTAIGSLSYLAIYALWNLYMAFFASHFTFCGHRSSKRQQQQQRLVCLRTEASLKDSSYRVYCLVGKNGAPKEILCGRVDRWITVNGHVAPKPFINDMQSALSKISEKAE